jgi:S-phase kinase-associated protein 1
MVSLTTSDNEQFTVDRDVAERSVLIKQMLEGESKPQGTIAISYSATT